MKEYIEMITTDIIRFLPKLLSAIALLIIGLIIIKVIIKGIKRIMDRKSIEKSLAKFLTNVTGFLLKALLLISVMTMLGIAVTSFLAILTAASLAVGLALKGHLANFAGGVMILIFKPFKVGDLIEFGSFKGTVNIIQTFSTILKTPDKKTLIIPNSSLSNGNIINYSTEPQRRVDMTFGIGYDDDIREARRVLSEIIAEDVRILKDPAPAILVSELGDSSVNFAVRVWCESADYWDIYFDMQEKVKLRFDQENISIPFPQRDIHIYQEANSSN